MHDIIALFYHDAERVWGQGDLGAVDERYADELVCHLAGDRSGALGRAAYRRTVAAWRAAFPDMQVMVVGRVADAGDLAVGRWLITGTHTGIWHDVLPTGQRIELEELALLHSVNGVIDEIWLMFDLETTLRRLSAAPEAVALA